MTEDGQRRRRDRGGEGTRLQVDEHKRPGQRGDLDQIRPILRQLTLHLLQCGQQLRRLRPGRTRRCCSTFTACPPWGGCTQAPPRGALVAVYSRQVPADDRDRVDYAQLVLGRADYIGENAEGHLVGGGRGEPRCAAHAGHLGAPGRDAQTAVGSSYAQHDQLHAAAGRMVAAAAPSRKCAPLSRAISIS